MNKRFAILPFQHDVKRLHEVLGHPLVEIGHCAQHKAYEECENLMLALYRFRLERSFKWFRSKDVSNRSVIRDVLGKYFDQVQCDLIEVVLADVLESILELFETYIEFSTWNVYTVSRFNQDAVLECHGDYRILKFEAEKAQWMPVETYAEELVYQASQNQVGAI